MPGQGGALAELAAQPPQLDRAPGFRDAPGESSDSCRRRRADALHLPSASGAGPARNAACLPRLCVGRSARPRSERQSPARPSSAIEQVDEGPIAVAQVDSRSGATNDGFLVRGVQLPAEGEDFFTWDPITGRLAQPPLAALGGRHARSGRCCGCWAPIRAAHPGAARVGIADISRPNGGPFGRRYGGLGHASHQNGLDVDLYYPREDGQERSITAVSQIDDAARARPGAALRQGRRRLRLRRAQHRPRPPGIAARAPGAAPGLPRRPHARALPAEGDPLGSGGLARAAPRGSSRRRSGWRSARNC